MSILPSWLIDPSPCFKLEFITFSALHFTVLISFTITLVVEKSGCAGRKSVPFFGPSQTCCSLSSVTIGTFFRVEGARQTIQSRSSAIVLFLYTWNRLSKVAFKVFLIIRVDSLDLRAFHGRILVYEIIEPGSLA